MKTFRSTLTTAILNYVARESAPKRLADQTSSFFPRKKNHPTKSFFNEIFSYLAFNWIKPRIFFNPSLTAAINLIKRCTLRLAQEISFSFLYKILFRILASGPRRRMLVVHGEDGGKNDNKKNLLFRLAAVGFVGKAAAYWRINKNMSNKRTDESCHVIIIIKFSSRPIHRSRRKQRALHVARA